MPKVKKGVKYILAFPIHLASPNPVEWVLFADGNRDCAHAIYTQRLHI